MKMQLYKNYLKRSFDFFFSIIVLIIISPVFVLIYFLVVIEDGFPGFFTHERIGFHGKKIHIIKFRSMKKNADEELKKILKNNSELKTQWENSFKLAHDPRVTKVGRVIRRTKLDELPQFANVVLGDLSVVGPRPITKEEFNKFFKSKEDIEAYQSVVPGVTGSWQVLGARNYEHRINLEIHYVSNISFLSDIKIIFKTLRSVLLLNRM